jgi:hypothetical protein
MMRACRVLVKVAVVDAGVTILFALKLWGLNAAFLLVVAE